MLPRRVSLALWQTALVFAAVGALAELARGVIEGVYALWGALPAAAPVLSSPGEKDEKK